MSHLVLLCCKTVNRGLTGRLISPERSTCATKCHLTFNHQASPNTRFSWVIIQKASSAVGFSILSFAQWLQFPKIWKKRIFRAKYLLVSKPDLQRNRNTIVLQDLCTICHLQPCWNISFHLVTSLTELNKGRAFIKCLLFNIYMYCISYLLRCVAVVSQRGHSRSFWVPLLSPRVYGKPVATEHYTSQMSLQHYSWRMQWKRQSIVEHVCVKFRWKNSIDKEALSLWHHTSA